MNQHFTMPCPETVAEQIGVPVTYITTPPLDIQETIHKAKTEYVRALLYHDPNVSRGHVARLIGSSVYSAGRIIYTISPTIRETAVDFAHLSKMPSDLRKIARAISDETGIAIGIIVSSRRVSVPIVAARNELLRRLRAARPSISSNRLAEYIGQDDSHIRHLIREGKI